MDENKYRIPLKSSDRGTYGSESYTRLDALKKIKEWEKQNVVIRSKKKIKFFQREISEEHKIALMECANLWAKLDDFENEINIRPRHSKPKRLPK
jgi:hypothetical protein